jgi:DNA-binding LacI/PurR family transcriptional regulator/DNA-binding transcriptional regulator YhcF (GntR family)
MALKMSQPPRILELAERLSADIRRRQLKPGDAYLTTAEAARLLGISTSTANRTLQLLTQRNVLARSQRKGSCVAAPVAREAKELRCLHLLAQRQHVEAEGVFADGRLIGIQSVFPSTHLRFDFLPENGEVAEIERLIKTALAERQPEGFIMIRASLQAQRTLAGCGLPVVLSGTPYPSVRGLSWMDRDHRQIGRLLAQHLLERGARSFLVLMRERMQQGDYLVFDAIRETLAEAGRADALTLRCLPHDVAATGAEVACFLESKRERVGIICRGGPLAEAAQAGVDADGRRSNRPLIAVCDLFGSHSDAATWPHVRPMLEAQEWGVRLGRLLLRQVHGDPSIPDHELVPVELVLPKSSQ